MTAPFSVKKDVFKVFLLALFSLFLIPVIAALFVHYAQPRQDARFAAVLERSFNGGQGSGNSADRDGLSYKLVSSPSRVCDDDSPEAARFRAMVCAPYSELWQFNQVGKLSQWTLIGGAGVLLMALSLGAIAFVNRRLQYFSFVAGWSLLTLSSAVEVVVQGVLLVWLSYWITVFFFHVYYLKIILLVGIAVALAAFAAIVHIFKRPPQNTSVDGALLVTRDSPKLWTHIRGLADRLGIAPPDHIVAGIDANFFVSQTPVTVSGQRLEGRTLFVSLPLLRVLDRSEADAVLVHELAHFRGGDTASSAALGPKLAQYDHYCQMMHAAKVTIFVFYVLCMYRLIFELALQRDSRAREFLADRTAADLVSAKAVAHSLVKIAAYARYRAEIERQLFSHERRHNDALGIAEHVASGLAPYAASANFVDAMKVASIPHPFDSHPATPERMKNVDYPVDERAYGEIVSGEPAHSWVDDIQTATEIEQSLWDTYERRFAVMHERSLAYRYEPGNHAELAIVLKYFPQVTFQLKNGSALHINYAGLDLPEQKTSIAWDKVVDLKYRDGISGDVLEIVHPEKGLIGAKTTKVKLPGIRKDRQRCKAVLAHYWQRHQIMREQNAMVSV